MKKNLLNVFAVSLIIFSLSAMAFAQDNNSPSNVGNLYVISADAGGVNYVEGKVSVKQNNGRNGYLLRGDKLEVGEKVMTGADGKAEILLNPGSYLRLAGNSDFEFATTSLDDLQLKLTRGSAMFEVITDNDFTFAVNTPKGHFYIIESGVYRIDVLGDGSGKIEVWKGKAQVGDGNEQIVKKGRRAIVNGNQVDVEIEKFDRDDKDALETWSKERAKELAKINSRLDKNRTRTALISSYRNNGWNLFGSYGLWIFDRFSGNYCFLPFGYGWSSPYGYGYGRDLWYMRMPGYVYQAPANNNNNQPTATRATLTSGSNVGSRAKGSDTTVNREVPPYLKVQRNIGRSPMEIDTSPSIFDGNPRYPSSTSPSQTSSPSVITPSSSSVPSTRGKGNN
ncbi:MAG: FecR domain-containing protein [Pyrinomonadaceae bacterium]